jgi:hypothetical protein
MTDDETTGKFQRSWDSDDEKQLRDDIRHLLLPNRAPRQDDATPEPNERTPPAGESGS